MDECLLTVCGYSDCDKSHSSASHISEIIGALEDYIVYRKLPSTPVLDIRLPSHRLEKPEPSYSSSDEAESQSPGKRMLLRFRSLVARPSHGYSPKKEIQRSTSILQHHSTRLDLTPPSPQMPLRKYLKTNSLDRKRNMPDLGNVTKKQAAASDSDRSRNDINGDVSSNNNLDSKLNVQEDTDRVDMRKDSLEESESNLSDAEVESKDMDKILDEDIHDHEKEEESFKELLNSTDSKGKLIVFQMVFSSTGELLSWRCVHHASVRSFPVGSRFFFTV